MSTNDATVRLAPRFRIPVPGGFRGEIGLGDLIKRFTGALGLETCGACARRASALNRFAAFSSPCWSFTGGCTGFGSRRCVSAPESQSPDATIVTQCCGGWFQYPWIEVCPGQPARMGCGFCLW
jgi:hypothetical protein